MGIRHARITEFNVNVSCSQNCSWDPWTGITSKIQLFPVPYIFCWPQRFAQGGWDDYSQRVHFWTDVMASITDMKSSRLTCNTLQQLRRSTSSGWCSGQKTSLIARLVRAAKLLWRNQREAIRQHNHLLLKSLLREQHSVMKLQLLRIVVIAPPRSFLIFG